MEKAYTSVSVAEVQNESEKAKDKAPTMPLEMSNHGEDSLEIFFNSLSAIITILQYKNMTANPLVTALKAFTAKATDST